MGITIERVSEASVDRLIALLEELARFERLPPPSAAAQARLRADALGPSPRFEAYLAVEDGEAIGCATLLTTYSTFRGLPCLYLEDLIVTEAHRGRGVGQALFDFCVRLTQERGCARLEWNVLNWNESAVRFYEKNQGIPVTEWTWYRRSVTP